MNCQTHLIGYWITSLKDEAFCAPQEVVGALAPDVRSRLADYLDAGFVDRRNSQFGFSWCRFFCGVPSQAMGSRELTDGSWSWPQGLSHYVRVHEVVLPEEFITHALEMGTPRTPASESVTQSRTLWQNWCAGRRSPKFLERLRHARAEADRRAPLVEQEYIRTRTAQEIARYGLGDETCIFAGCKEQVLGGMKLCARHIIRDEIDRVADPCYWITPELVA